MENFDIFIIGAGPAGLALARQLADAPLKVGILERLAEAELAEPGEDGRDIALTHASEQIMEDLGMWPHIPEAQIGVIRDAEEMLRQLLRHDIAFEVNVAPGTRCIFADAGHIEQIVVNLVLNAHDAMPEGGTLSVTCANADLDEAHADVHMGARPGPHAMLIVSDTGAGMSPETLKKAFEPFFTTKDVGKGSGLGLSMVYGFAKQSNGHATINSEAGHGTAIELYLPRSEEFVNQEDVRSEAPGPARGSECILVVEDDEDLREIPTTMLRDYGYEVVEARNGKEAILCLQDSQIFDLLFTDAVLAGGMNGLEIADEAKRIQPGIKILFTSGYPESIVSHGGKVNQDAALLNKPYLRATLLEMVRAVLDSADT